MGFGIRELASPSESSATSVPKLPNAAPTIQHSTMSPDAVVAARTTASSMGDALAASGLVIPIGHQQTFQVASNTSDPGEREQDAEGVRSITSPRYQANELEATRDALGCERTTNLIPFDERATKLNGTFSTSLGRSPDVPVNRAIIQETARTGKLVRSGPDGVGGEYQLRASELPNGKEAWSQVDTDRAGRASIVDGGFADRGFAVNRKVAADQASFYAQEARGKSAETVSPHQLQGRSFEEVENILDKELVEKGGWTKESSNDGNGLRYLNNKGGLYLINRGYPNQPVGDVLHSGPYLKISPGKIRIPLSTSPE